MAQTGSPSEPALQSTGLPDEQDLLAFQQKSRITGTIALLFSLLLITITSYVYIRFELIRQIPEVTVAFMLAILGYAVLSVYLILMQRRNVDRFTTQNRVLKTLIENYQRRTEELQVAAIIARDASIETDVPTLLQRAVELLTQSFSIYNASIFLIDETSEEKVVVLHASGGSAGIMKLPIETPRLAVGQTSVIGSVAESGKARVVLDSLSDPIFKYTPLLPETRSELAVPLRLGTRVMGVLDVQSKTTGSFTQNDVIVMQTLADLLAIAVNKTTLNHQVSEYASNLETMVEQRTHQLASERAQLNAILDGMTEGVIYFEDRNPVYINQALIQMLGYAVQELASIETVLLTEGRTPAEASLMREHITESIRRDGAWRGQLRLRRKDQSELDALVSAGVLRHNSHEGFLLVVTDISQQKALQEQQTRFVAYASHELRTPLANLKTRMYLLKRQPQLFEKHFTIIQQVVDRMQRLVDDLLTTSRFERGLIEMKREQHSLAMLVKEVVDLQRDEAEKKSLSLHLEIPSHPVDAMIDRDRIVQVVTNLIANAINYTPEGGSVRVMLQVCDPDDAEIIIADTGVGIPEHYMPQVFQPFFRADNVSQNGTGLGLNISRQIVDLHGGEISVESEVNKGSQFKVRLKRMLP